MASAYKRKGTWFLRVQDAAGRWVKEKSSARTKTEADRLAFERQQKLDRERDGLDPTIPRNGGETVGELLQWWLAEHSLGTPSHDWAERAVKNHLLPSDLARLSVFSLRPHHVEAFLARKGHEELAPQTLNHLRGLLSRAYNKARTMGRWAVANPIADVRRRKVHAMAFDFLQVEEVPLVLAALDARWRPLFATAIFTGLRKGELLALRKVDVDLKNRRLTVCRSHERNTTKGGRHDVSVIPIELLPFLAEAIATSPSELVFPGKDGNRMARDVGLEHVLRRAMGRAGVVTGYEHVCRKQGCSHKEAVPDDALRRCPEHHGKLWPKPRVRPIRFHDLRHTTASLYLMAGLSPVAVQRIMRHKDPRLTTERYGHLAPGFMQSEVDKLSLGLHDSKPNSRQETVEKPLKLASNSVSFVPPVSPGRENREEAGQAHLASAQNSAAFSERRKGFEPSTPSLGSRAEDCPTVDTPSQSFVSSRLSGGSPVQPSQAFSAIAKHFVPDLSPGRVRLKVLAGTGRPLLTVAQVAERLAVCRATVYALVERGELVHVRVSNAIRIAPDAVEAFIGRSQS